MSAMSIPKLILFQFTGIHSSQKPKNIFQVGSLFYQVLIPPRLCFDGHSLYILSVLESLIYIKGMMYSHIENEHLSLTFFHKFCILTIFSIHKYISL
jgi:hypothetical protein